MSTMNINKRNLYTTASALVLSGPLVAQQPNIILFLVDDMGWQDASVPFGAEPTKLKFIIPPIWRGWHKKG